MTPLPRALPAKMRYDARKTRSVLGSGEPVSATAAAAKTKKKTALTVRHLDRYGRFRMPSECAALEWTDIDFAAGRMIINAPKTRRHRSGGAESVRCSPSCDRTWKTFSSWPDPVRRTSSRRSDVRQTCERCSSRSSNERGTQLCTSCSRICEHPAKQSF